MNRNHSRTTLLLGMILCSPLVSPVASEQARADQIAWTDWTAATTGNSGTAAGVMATTCGPVSLNYAGELYFGQTSPGGRNYWVPSAPYLSTAVSNAPASTDILAICGTSGTYSVVFSSPVRDPYMAIVSLGQPSVPVLYTFSVPIRVISAGAGYWGNGVFSVPTTHTLSGREGHGVIQLLGDVSTVTWTVSGSECWQGFSFGIPAAPQAAVIPALACPGSPASFSVLPLGSGPFGFRWQARDASAPGGWRDLSDGTVSVGPVTGNIVGSSQAQLSWSGVGSSAPAFRLGLRCQVSGTCGSLPSSMAELVICKADFNCDQTISVQDLFDFLVFYFLGDTRADLQPDGMVSVQDVFDFLAVYFGGCA